MNFTDTHHIHVLGGQYAVSADPDMILMTVLGSCVSACIYDTVTNVGGMNHFILPTSGGLDIAERPERYGDLAMRTLVDDLYDFGAERPESQGQSSLAAARENRAATIRDLSIPHSPDGSFWRRASSLSTPASATIWRAGSAFNRRRAECR
ncbi:chemotaxis protein CheD [Neorhizobium galegae]|nr:chemotaxis protein CheD [Neorhizobium galegae]